MNNIYASKHGHRPGINTKSKIDPDAWQTPSFRAGKDRARSQRLRFPNDIGDTVLQGGEDVHSYSLSGSSSVKSKSTAKNYDAAKTTRWVRSVTNSQTGSVRWKGKYPDSTNIGTYIDVGIFSSPESACAAVAEDREQRGFSNNYTISSSREKST